MLEAWGLSGCFTPDLTSLTPLRASLLCIYLFITEAAPFFITSSCEGHVIICRYYSPRLHSISVVEMQP